MFCLSIVKELKELKELRHMSCSLKTTPKKPIVLAPQPSIGSDNFFNF